MCELFNQRKSSYVSAVTVLGKFIVGVAFDTLSSGISLLISLIICFNPFYIILQLEQRTNVKTRLVNFDILSNDFLTKSFFSNN